MKIGIIGSGMIGETAARLFVKAGHEIAISNSRGPESLKELVRELGPQARATHVEDASAFGEVVLLAVPLKAYRSLPRAQLSGKIVIDAMNYYPQRDGQIDFKGHASSEFVAQHLPGARIVKAFNTLYFVPLGKEGKPGAPPEDRLVLFVAGDDAEAKQTVSRLIDQIGFTPIDTGRLATGGKRQQPGTAIYNRTMKPAEAREALSTL